MVKLLRKQMRVLILAAFLPLFASPAIAAEKVVQPGPRKLVENFYRKYLVPGAKKKPDLPFSRSFRALIAENRKLCGQLAKGDVCGFGADGDIWLDAQDFAPDLTFKNAGGEITEPEPGKVLVKMNLFPADKELAVENSREITYSFLQEGGKWVVDDIDYKSHSARKDIQLEMSTLKQAARSK